MNSHYKLDGHLPMLCHDLLEWAEWFETAKRHVALTRVGPVIVSTVFLGIDHDFRSWLSDIDPLTYQPLIFETMAYVEMPVFVGRVDSPVIVGPSGVVELPHDFLDEQTRCRTWDEAVLMHRAMVEKLKESGDPEEDLMPVGEVQCQKST